ncbi:MAG TPA: RsmE family RNA methyltransferase, partial [Enhygromyxa sp.]|nr:RsmE family RNA methyltransferase [Enhygromyxa sp.]
MSIRAFAPAGVEPSPGATIELDEQESHYLVKVRRARVGEALELFDGRGRAWTAIVRASGRRARVEVEAALPVAEPVPRVLLLGLPDQPATLEALTGASELGATHVVLVACERSQGRVPSVERIERVLRASQRQCGRPRPVELIGADPLPLARALALRD